LTLVVPFDHSVSAPDRYEQRPAVSNGFQRSRR